MYLLCGPELFYESSYPNNLEGQDYPFGLQLGDHAQRREASTLRSHSQEEAEGRVGWVGK